MGTILCSYYSEDQEPPRLDSISWAPDWVLLGRMAPIRRKQDWQNFEGWQHYSSNNKRELCLCLRRARFKKTILLCLYTKAAVMALVVWNPSPRVLQVWKIWTLLHLLLPLAQALTSPRIQVIIGCDHRWQPRKHCIGHNIDKLIQPTHMDLGCWLRGAGDVWWTRRSVAPHRTSRTRALTDLSF